MASSLSQKEVKIGKVGCELLVKQSFAELYDLKLSGLCVFDHYGYFIESKKIKIGKGGTDPWTNFL